MTASSKASRILLLHTSVNVDSGFSRRLCKHFVSEWKKKFPQTEFVERDLVDNPIPHFDADAFQALRCGKEPSQLNQVQLEKVRISDELYEELKNVDTIVISAPMYNLTIPSTLKAYLDHLIQFGRTFTFDENGAVSLVNDKKTYILATAGGGSLGTVDDFVTTYLKHVFKYLGLHNNMTVFSAKNLLMPEGEKFCVEAEKEITNHIEQI